MKQLATLALIALLAVGLVVCGGESAEPRTPRPPPPAASSRPRSLPNPQTPRSHNPNLPRYPPTPQCRLLPNLRTLPSRSQWQPKRQHQRQPRRQQRCLSRRVLLCLGRRPHRRRRPLFYRSQLPRQPLPRSQRLRLFPLPPTWLPWETTSYSSPGLTGQLKAGWFTMPAAPSLPTSYLFRQVRLPLTQQKSGHSLNWS